MSGTAWRSAAPWPSGVASWPCPTSFLRRQGRRGAAGAVRVLQAPRGHRRSRRPAEELGVVKVAAVQHDICWEAPRETVAHVAPLIAAAAAAGARIVVLAEMYSTGSRWRPAGRRGPRRASPRASWRARGHPRVWVAASVPTADASLPRPVNRLVVAGPTVSTTTTTRSTRSPSPASTSTTPPEHIPHVRDRRPAGQRLRCYDLRFETSGAPSRR